MAVMRGVTIFLVAVVILGITYTVTPSGVLSGARAAVRASAAAQACGQTLSYSPATAAAASEIMAGRLTIAPFPAATVDPGHDGDIDWSMDPFDDPTWVSSFLAGDWMEPLVAGYLAGASQALAYRARAKLLVLSWLRNVPVQDRDPDTVICMSEAFAGQSWITGQIPVAVDYYAAHWMGAWNHGLKQDIELLRIGCAYPAGAFGGQALTWRRTAYQQMLASFAPNRLGPAVDAQGATNEQSTGYASLVYALWKRAEHNLAACGYTLPSWITARIALMPAFLAEATEPDGDYVQIGDTYVEAAAKEPPAALVAVYRRGYVFGRSGWGPGASYYSLRFGPARQVHGHNDHMSLTYYARGRNLIVNAGHFGYQVDAYRDYIRSPEASSMLVLPGVPFHPSAATSLISQHIGADGQFFEFFDRAFGGDPRYRSVYISEQPDLILVFDRASGGSRYQQLWHLDPGLTVTTVTRDYAIASAPGTELEIRQIPLPGQVIPEGSTQVVEGQTNPYQGWVSHQMLQRIPAPVITMTRTGPSAAILTLIVPASPGTPIGASIRPGPDGTYHVQVTVGGTQESFTVSTNGAIQHT